MVRQEFPFEILASCPACNASMLPSDDVQYPHAFVCPKCTGQVDIQIGLDRLHEYTCGGITVNGIRCEVRIPAGRTVCENCTYVAALEWVKETRGRKVLAALLADDEVEAARMEARRRREEEMEAKRRKAQEEGNQPAHVVYYARLGKNHIKIGTTNRLSQRMVELRVVNADNLLAAEPGGFDVEHQRHEQFKKWRYNRRKEDFGEGKDLLEHIQVIRSQFGDPYELAARMLAERSPQQ